MIVRESVLSDLPVLMAIYGRARSFMAEHGNPDQWTGGYPSRELIECEISSHHSFVCVNESDNSIVGTFCFIYGNDPSYNNIDGSWLNEEPYGTIHRIASSGKIKGVFKACLDWCSQRCCNLRIDTHKDNYPMQRAIMKHGFSRCGIIYLPGSGSPRIAYQKTVTQSK